MKKGQTQQFDTFDNKSDRYDLRLLFEKLGTGLPEPLDREVRKRWLEMLIVLSLTGLDKCPVEIDRDSCHPAGAYSLFISFVGILGVPISDAAKLLEDCVRKKAWLDLHWLEEAKEIVDDRRLTIVG